jgi:hypothetical protein
MLSQARAFDIEDVRQRLAAGDGGYEIVHASPGLEVGVYLLVAPEPRPAAAARGRRGVDRAGRSRRARRRGRARRSAKGPRCIRPCRAEHRFIGYEHLSVLVIFERRTR